MSQPSQPYHPAYVPVKMPEMKPIQRYKPKPMPRPSVETMPPRPRPTEIRMNVFQGMPQVMRNFDPKGGGGGGETGGTGSIKFYDCDAKDGDTPKAEIIWKDGVITSGGDFSVKVGCGGSPGS